MDLKDFIKNSLIDIRTGIRESNEEIKKIYGGEGPFNLGEMKSKIEFDIAVTSEESVEGKIGGGIKVLAVDIGSKIEGGSKSGNISRIKFSIYTALNFLQ